MRNQDWLILNIDDQQAIRYAKTRALQRAGFKVMEADSGTEGIACVEKYRPPLVICDVKMPDMSGLEVCRIVKDRFPGTMVLQVSASFVTARDRADGLDRGADSYLTEPVEPEELVASVRALLRMKEFENDLRAANARREFLYALAEKQRSLDLAERILAFTAEQLGRHLKAHRVGVYAVEGESLRFLACWTDGVLPDLRGEGPLALLGKKLVGEYEAGRTIAVADIAADGYASRPLGYSAIGVPLLRSGRWQATLFVNGAGERAWSTDEVSLVEEAAKLTWDAVERARARQDLLALNERLEERIAARTRELMQAEEQLRQSQKMEAVGQLTGGIAHDFNNLLTGIIGGINIVRRRIAKGQTEDVNRFMDEVVNSAHRAAGLIHRLLAFSRRQSLDFKAVDIARMVESLAGLFRRTLGENIALKIQCDAGLWTATTDANQLETALLNLVINARDAMPGGGSLMIVASNRAVTPEQRVAGLSDGDYVVLQVSDNGTGMPKDVIEKAFDPFFTTKPEGEGTGLGLSMVYGFAKQAGGTVEIDSFEGRGTNVRIYVPRSRELPPPDIALPQTETQRSKGGETVLLAEDNPSVRVLIADLLAELGYDAIISEDGQRAADMLSSGRRIDLLISDVGLPGLNGRQVAEIGRQKWPLLKILFITGYAEAARLRSGFLPEGADMIAKPFEMDALAGKIRELLNSGARENAIAPD